MQMLLIFKLVTQIHLAGQHRKLLGLKVTSSKCVICSAKLELANS